MFALSIRHLPDSSARPGSAASKDSDVRASSRRSYDTCVQASNHITSTGEWIGIVPASVVI